MTIN
jgi:nucleolar protein 12